MIYRRFFIGIYALLVLLSARAQAEDFALDLDLAPGATQQFAIAPDALLTVEALRVQARVRPTTRAAEREVLHAVLELTLTTLDHRGFVSAASILLSGGDSRVPLTPAMWAGADGQLGADALATVTSLMVRVHGLNQGHLTGAIVTTARTPTAPTALTLSDGGLIERGPWRELALVLSGREGERGDLDLLTERGRIPCFLDQPGRVVDGRWRAHGPARWLARLRPNEDLTGAIPAWRLGELSWRGSPLPALAVVRRAAFSEVVAQALPLPESPVWRAGSADPGVPTLRDERGIWLRQPLRELPVALAPVLAWRADWTGFRGPERISYPQALAFDAALAKGLTDIDLLPQTLAEEQGAFRFGLSPWQAAAGGPWASVAELMAHDEPWRAWPAHVRNVVARARAAPGLLRWRMGLTAPLWAGADEARLKAMLDACAAAVTAIDERVLIALHPHLAAYGYGDKGDGVWCDFEAGVDGWQAGPLPVAAWVQQGAVASHGAHGLDLIVAAAQPVMGRAAIGRVAGAWLPLNSNWFNLDTLQFDAQLSAPAGASMDVYAWLTDEHYRWYQRRIGEVRAGSPARWLTLDLPFADDAAWQPVGHNVPWTTATRRRVRALGIVGFLHAASDETAAGEAVLHLDHLRRRGWPAEVAPTLAITASAAPATLPRWSTLMLVLAVNLSARNPYDPDTIDVGAEIEGPDGVKLRYPAYWSEPFTLTFTNGVERPLPDGAGGWHLRWTPPKAGVWRWRPTARLLYRERWLEAQGDWQTVTVSPHKEEALPPVRVSKTDPFFFEDADGGFFYPLGLTLRSPGDDRSQRVLAEVLSARDRTITPTRPIIRSEPDYLKMGTRAYERWLPELAKNGGNWARVWMCPWWCGLEWNAEEGEGFNGLTWYNQANAAQFDRVCELAEANRVYLQIELQAHGMAGNFADGMWDRSPYNRRRGGMCAPGQPEEFFTRDDAWAVHAKRLRYTIARWGWRTGIAAWVLTSEMEFTGGYRADSGGNESQTHTPIARAWTQRSLDWFAANDGLRRPVSVHFSHPWEGVGVWELPGLGFGNSNAYTAFQDGGNRLGGHGRNLPLALERYLVDHFPPWRDHRPTLIGEWGGHWENNNHRQLSAELHSGLWVQAVMPFGGNTGFWWSIWLDGADRWDEFAAVAAYLKGDDRRGRTWTLLPRTQSGRTQFTGMRAADSLRIYAWVDGADQSVRPAVLNWSATVPCGAAGAHWQVSRWDCQRGVIADTATLTADAVGAVTLTAPRLDPDAAFTLTCLDARLPAADPGSLPASGPSSAPASTAPASTSEVPPASTPVPRQSR